MWIWVRCHQGPIQCAMGSICLHQSFKKMYLLHHILYGSTDRKCLVRETYRDRKWISSCSGQGVGWEMGVVTKGYRVSF